MEIINIIKIKNGVVDDIESYAIWEEQFSRDVVETVQERFLDILVHDFGWNEDDDYMTEEDILDNDYYETEVGSLCISWSSIN